MKKIINAIIVFVTSFSLFGFVVNAEETAEKAVEGGTLKLPIQSDPDVMNPLFSYDSTTGAILNSLYDPLFELNGDEIIYKLAESIEPSEDFLTYTLKLKEELKWHDGEPITSDDIVFSVKAILDEKQESYKRDSLVVDGKPIEVNAIDDLTIEFKLQTVSVPFLVDLSKVTPIPAHIFEGEEKISESQKNEEPVGSGPFKLKEIKSGEYVLVEKFDDYYGGAPIIDNIEYRIIADPQASQTALLNGELDYLSIGAEDIPTFDGNEAMQVYVYDNKRVSNMIFKLKNEDLAKLNVRKAISYAINKEELIEGNYGDTGLSEKAYSFYPPKALFYTDEVERYEFDQEKSKELLKEEGYNTGDINLVIGYTNANAQQETYALIMQQQLSEVGINVEVKAMERGAFVEELVNPESDAFDIAYNSYALGLEPSKYAPLLLSGNANNFMGYSNEEVDELFAKGVTETDDTKRSEIYGKIQKIVLEELPLLPIDYPANVAVFNSKIRGLDDPENGRFFTDLSKVYFVE